MTKTVVNLTDTLGTVVTKVNKISNDLGDIEGHFLYDSSMTGAITKLQHGRDLDSAGIRGLISVTNSGGSGSIAYNNSTGVLTYAGVGAFNTVDDTTPQLGGDLDANSKRIILGDHTVNANLSLGNKIVLGADSDLKIYHDGTNSYVQSLARPLILKGGAVRMHSSAGADMLSASTGGTIKLYHDGTKKIETTAVGVTVTGAMTATGLLVGTGVTAGSAVLSEADLEQIDDLTAGTVTASKAVVVDANKHITGFGNITATGAITAGSLVIGSADISEAELEILDGANVSTDELNLLDLASGEQVGVFKVEAISAGNPVSGDFTNNTKIIFQY